MPREVKGAGNGGRLAYGAGAGNSGSSRSRKVVEAGNSDRPAEVA